MKFKSYDKQINILDWLIILSVIILFIMVYLPQNIWSEESKYKKDRRSRMEIISNAEDFYYELTGEYTLNINELFVVVESAMDSLIADSLFYGNQKINLDKKTYNVNIEKDFSLRVDTTFSIPEKVKKMVYDTILTIGVKNKETNLIDTFDTNSKNLSKYEMNSLFDEIYNSRVEGREEYIVNYLRKKYHLNDSLEFCPISKNNLSKKFIIDIDKTNEKEHVFKISSPVTEQDKEWRFGIFRYTPGKQESIINGIKSWAGD